MSQVFLTSSLEVIAAVSVTVGLYVVAAVSNDVAVPINSSKNLANVAAPVSVVDVVAVSFTTNPK